MALNRRNLANRLSTRELEEIYQIVEKLPADIVVIPGLYAAGELASGIFYFDYPGGTSSISGSLFGRLVSTSTADAAVGI